jgi:hypothetical protein
MKIVFDHDYQQKILTQTFPEPVLFAQDADVLQWRQLWMDALKSWHSPYKALIDGRQLRLAFDADKARLQAAFQRMDKVLTGLFLKKAIVFGVDEELAALLPFETYPDEEAAYQALGIRVKAQTEPQDFRSSIQLQNHFRQHVIELSFGAEAVIDTKEKLAILKSKLTNNLMQWHSAWSLLVDCSQLSIAEDLFPEFEKMVKFFRGFFLKEVLGYQPRQKDLKYPFPVYRARHNAAGRLEAEGLFSGEDAQCRSRKPEDPQK